MPRDGECDTCQELLVQMLFQKSNQQCQSTEGICLPQIYTYATKKQPERSTTEQNSAIRTNCNLQLCRIYLRIYLPSVL